MKGSGGFVAAVFGDQSEIGQIVRDLGREAGRAFSGESGRIAAEAASIAKAYQLGEISVEAFAASLAGIDDAEANKAVADLVARLREIAPVAKAAETALSALGHIPGLDDAVAAVADLRGEMETLAENEFSVAPIQREIAALIKDFEDGQRSAEDTKAALQEIELANPDFGPFIARVMTAIGALNDLRMSAILAGASMAALSVVGGGSAGGAGDVSDARQSEATQAFSDEIRRQNDLSRERQDIEKRTERIMQDAAKAGAALTREQAEQLAIEQAAADARRAEEGRSGRAGGGSGRGGKGKKRTEYADEVIQIREMITALEEETNALNDAELSLQGYADVAAYVQKRMELLVAAKKQGLTVTPQLAAEIDNLAREYVEAANALEMAKERHDEFEAAMNEARSSMESAFTGLITGAHGFRDALSQVLAKLAEMAASRAFNAIWDGGGRRGSGGGIGGGIGRFFGSILGFASGGYTGSGAPGQAAGIVHKGEYVMSAPAVQRIGLPNLVTLHRGGTVGDAPKITINNNAPGVEVVTESVTRDEVRLMIVQGIAGNSRRGADNQYLGRGR